MLAMSKSKRLTAEQRNAVGQKVMEWGNLLFGGLVVAQFIPGTSQFRPLLFLIGVTGMFGGYIIGIQIMRGGE